MLVQVSSSQELDPSLNPYEMDLEFKSLKFLRSTG